MSTAIDIGDQITSVVKGTKITGVVVGIEPSSQRRGYPQSGHVLQILPSGSAGGPAVEVHSGAIVPESEP